MIRYYNGGFDHEKLLNLTFRQFLMYYSNLTEMLEMEGGKKKDDQKRNPQTVMQEIKNTFQK